MNDLDKALELSLHGELEESYRILEGYYEKYPDDNRGAYNLGLHEMRHGNLLKGHEFLFLGRQENVFGNRHIGTNQPFWTNETGKVVLMEMEGGLGDQIHAIRYAKDIASKGNRVVISGSENLAGIMINCEGVSSFCMHEAAIKTYHDYWVPSMSAPMFLRYEFDDISGKPYIARDGESEGKIGVKWSGNPMFEHEQHRLFASQLMFDAVKDEDCISLQKKDGETDSLADIPSWMEKPFLKTWSDTRRQISRCDVVVTSCTAVAHLAGAMGVETWVVVPILSYYLWATPGNKSPYYDSVTLFRQEEYGNWDAPFTKIKQALFERRANKLREVA